MKNNQYFKRIALVIVSLVMYFPTAMAKGEYGAWEDVEDGGGSGIAGLVFFLILFVVCGMCSDEK